MRGGDMAMQRFDLEQVRASVKEQLGSRVQIKTDEGRHRTNTKEGVLQEAYPCVFTIRVDDDSNQILSFSYTDILTQEIKMCLC